ncbi:MAG: M48 family metallopeptidase [Candidatus Brocadiae bacterium]|nr:M48 family metallopeptidase [Candidatus Brocadiia bacterium]
MKKIKIEKIIRSNRKTIALTVTPDATLIVRAPMKTSLDYIENLVQKKRLWIESKQEFFQKNSQKYFPKEFVNGEGFWYLGKEYKLEIVENQEIPVILENTLKIAKECLPFAKKCLVQWYKQMAFYKISQRAKRYAKETGLSYNTIRITDAQKRWGSCGPKGTLNFSWRLIMSPMKILDYVVVHELAHLEEPNHSSRFWNKVKVLLPDYKERQEWLKENGNRLRV